MRRLVLVLALLSAGCPAPSSGDVEARQTSALVVTIEDGDAAVAVGDTRTLAVRHQEAADHDRLFGAMIAHVDSNKLTRWHSDPPDAVAFDQETLGATFRRSGEVTVWATWETPQGWFRSNDLRFAVAEHRPGAGSAQ